VNLRKYIVLAGVTLFAAGGDSLLSHGMKQLGSISLNHLQGVIFAILNPWVAAGIILLLAFFASYMTALSWADLTYVLPATSLGYVLLALVAKFALHEQVSPMRWAGIALIAGGVGFVAGGPSLTSRTPRASGGSRSCRDFQRGRGMKHLYANLYTWSAILAIVFASVVGDVRLSRAMKQVGDVGALRRRQGLWTVIVRVLGNQNFVLGVAAMAVAFFSLLFALSWGDVSLVAPAAASLTFIGNAFAAKIFLHERVDQRRWIAAVLVAGGVALLAG